MHVIAFLIELVGFVSIKLYLILEVLNKLEVTPDVPIIMLHVEEALLLPRNILSVSANHYYCMANWNIVEGKIPY